MLIDENISLITKTESFRAENVGEEDARAFLEVVEGGNEGMEPKEEPKKGDDDIFDEIE
jgi:hypothetical protein